MFDHIVRVTALLAWLAMVLVASAWWTLTPLDRAARRRRHPRQFRLADFLCLMLLLQIYLAFGHPWLRTIPALRPGHVWLFDALGGLACGLVWWYAVHNLSRAGVHGALGRSAFLLIVAPVTVAGSLAAGWLPLKAFNVSGTDPLGGPQVFLLLSVDVAMIVAIYLSGLLTRLLLRTATTDPSD